MKFRPGVDILRTLAVFLVVISNLQINDKFSSYSFIGIDIFFVLSGFLITSWLVDEYSKSAQINKGYGRISLQIFYFTRAKRILPGMMIVLLMVVLFSKIFLDQVQTDRIIIDGIFALFFVANINLISQGADGFHSGFDYGPLDHFWTLSILGQFYLFFPILFLIAVNFHGLKLGKFRIGWERRLSMLIGTMTLISFSWYLIQSIHSPGSAYFSAFSYIWNFGSGSLLALMISKLVLREKPFFRFALSIFGVFGVLLSLFILNLESHSIAIYGLLTTVSTCCLIYIGTTVTSESVISRFMSLDIFSHIAKISYSLYLWQVPFFILIPPIIKSEFGWSVSRVDLLIPIYLFSLLTYLYIERPIRAIRPPEIWRAKSL